MAFIIKANGRPLKEGATREQSRIKTYATLAEASRALSEWHNKAVAVATYDTQPRRQEGLLIGFRSLDGFNNQQSYSIEIE